MKLKTIWLCVASTVLFTACHKRYEEIISTHPNGQNELVYEMQGNKENAKRVGEKMYYADGRLRWEKQFTDDQPSGTWSYYYGNGQLFAQGNFSARQPQGSNWTFYTAAGATLHNGPCDSVVVTAFTPDLFPTTIGYCHGDTIWAYEVYEDLALRATGRLVKGARDGYWVFYYPNGIKQAEATYSNGVENGIHSVYRENGIPYYRGPYSNGKRTGTWKIYDAEGNLSGTKNFDA